ncbi:MAG: 16S rRNA (guanine(527)-N(7))-methyltransferase RsmG [Treponemataceae bacterium]
MLKKGLEALGVAPEKINEIANKLELYVKELELFNAAYDLVGADTHEQIIVRHIFDSLAAYKNLSALIKFFYNFSDHVSIADIGSGGGLPGIPLSIVFPEEKFTLIERMSKRCSFLENCKAVLGLENVSVKCTQAENIENNSFDIVVFRAFRPLDKKMIKTLLRILTENGKLAAYKARPEKIAEEMDNIKQLAPVWESIPLSVPFLPQNRRHLVVIPKKQN